MGKSISPEFHFSSSFFLFNVSLAILLAGVCNQRGAPPLATSTPSLKKHRAHLDLLSIPRLWGKKCQNVSCLFLKKKQNAPRPSEHPPAKGEKMSKRLDGIKGCKYKTSYGIQTGSLMKITLGQQYNVGEKPTVILYIYINRHAGTPEKH